MAPTERIHLPFRWQFVPLAEGSDRTIRWRWRAYTHGGSLAMESAGSFETLTECMDDAKSKGYGAE